MILSDTLAGGTVVLNHVVEMDEIFAQECAKAAYYRWMLGEESAGMGQQRRNTEFPVNTPVMGLLEKKHFTI